jgi:hypothetical protein
MQQGPVLDGGSKQFSKEEGDPSEPPSKLVHKGERSRSGEGVPALLSSAFLSHCSSVSASKQSPSCSPSVPMEVDSVSPMQFKRGGFFGRDCKIWGEGEGN